jgi:hypothetical protein
MEKAMCKGIDRVHLQICGSVRGWDTDGQTAGERGSADGPLRINVPYTTPALTRAALGAASSLAADLRAEAVLLAVREIPYPLPLDRPNFRPEIVLEQLKALTDGIPCSVRIELVLTRNKKDVFQRILGRGAIAVVATRKRWWRTGEERLARFMIRAGCKVSLLAVDAEGRGIIARRMSPAAGTTTAGVATEEVNHA